MPILSYSADCIGALPPAAHGQWSASGVLVFTDFFSPDQCAALRARAAALCASLRPTDPAVAFETEDQSHAQSDHFATSGGEIRMFVEPSAPGLVNKLGHALHDRDPLFRSASRDPRLASLSRALGLTEPLLVQSMYLFKPPISGGAVPAHQDATFLRTDPPSVLGFWVALHDADRDNGCLWALTGQHREAGPRSVFGYAGSALKTTVREASPWPEASAVPLEVRAGTLVVLHGLLPHLSHANRSGRPREAYALHVVDGAAQWHPDNWLRRDGPFSGFQ